MAKGKTAAPPMPMGKNPMMVNGQVVTGKGMPCKGGKKG